jgi:hypothetical protein
MVVRRLTPVEATGERAVLLLDIWLYDEPTAPGGRNTE